MSLVPGRDAAGRCRSRANQHKAIQPSAAGHDFGISVYHSLGVDSDALKREAMNRDFKEASGKGSAKATLDGGELFSKEKDISCA